MASSVEIECPQGDIVCQRAIDAVVSSANARLMPGIGLRWLGPRTAGRVWASPL
jgi:O-acetyl-ADP-ribose deacetylase (regulator of RNase III)